VCSNNGEHKACSFRRKLYGSKHITTGSLERCLNCALQPGLKEEGRCDEETA